MPLWIVIGVAAAIFVLVFVVAASFNVFSSETDDEASERWTGLPADFTSADLEGVCFRPALRGYRMDDVDAAMEMMGQRLRALEEAAGTDVSTAPEAADARASESADPSASETATGPR
jgi:DivIVA domain-containing protein